MKKNYLAILYGLFGDVAALSAFSNLIGETASERFSLVTLEKFSRFSEVYGAYKQVIPFDPSHPEISVTHVNDMGIDVLSDLHSSSFNSPEYIEWLQTLHVAKIRTAKCRCPAFFNPMSPIELLEDRIIDSDVHNVQNYSNRLGAFGITLGKDMLRLYPTADDYQYSLEEKLRYSKRPIVSLVPKSNFSYKEWDLDNWCALSDRLITRTGAQLIINCATYEMPELLGFAQSIGAIIYAAETPETQVRNLLVADLVITIDTGLKHIACYLGLPVISLYGHTTPSIWGTLSSTEIPVLSPFPCDTNKDSETCKSIGPPCINYILPSQVFKAVEKAIGELHESLLPA